MSSNKTYRMEDLIGITLYATNAVPVRYQPFDAAKVARTIDPGQPVGVLDTWHEPKEGRSKLYFGFRDSQGIHYYTPLEKGLYDTQVIEYQVEQKKGKGSLGDWLNSLFSSTSKTPQLALLSLIAIMIIKSRKR